MYDRIVSKYVILFKTNKLRFILTIIGIFIGGLIFLVGKVVTDSMELEMLNIIEEFPSDTIVYSDISLNSYKYLDRIEDTEYLIPYYRDKIAYSTTVDQQPYYYSFDVVATTNMFFQTGIPYEEGISTSNINYQAGRIWTIEEASNNEMVILISNYVAEFFFQDEDPLNKYISIPNLGSFEVIGIYEDTIEFKQQKEDLLNFESNNDTIFLPDFDVVIPISTYLHITNKEMDMFSYVVQVHPQAFSVSGAISTTYNTSQINDLCNHVTRQSMLNLIEEQLEEYQEIFTVVFIVSILLSGIIIMNTMFFSVKERFFEIGLRVSLGASKIDILKQFMIEAVILSVIGALITIIFLQFVVVMINLISAKSFVLILKQEAIILYLCICILQSILFCLAPALYATRIKVIDALKFD